MVTRNGSQSRARPKRHNKKKKRRLNPAALIVVGIVAAVLALAALFVWWLIANPKEGGMPESACFLLIDMTSSTTELATSPDGYQAVADKVIEGCAERSSSMLIAWFDQSARAIKYERYEYGDSDAPGEILVERTFPLYSDSARTESVREAQSTEAKLAATDAVARILTTTAEGNRGSDILSALAESAEELRRLAEDVSTDSVFLILLTDANQISDSYSFEAFAEDGSVQQYVDDALDAGYVANLSGMVINFAAIETGLGQDGLPIPGWYLDQKEEFWTLYAKTSGGDMCFYGYDSSFLPVDC